MMKKLIRAFSKTKEREKYGSEFGIPFSKRTESREYFCKPDKYRSYQFDTPCQCDSFTIAKDSSRNDKLTEINHLNQTVEPELKPDGHCKRLPDLLSDENEVFPTINCDRVSSKCSVSDSIDELNLCNASNNTELNGERIREQTNEESGKKSKGSVYVITIANSRNFHIGNCTTVNSNKSQDDHLKQVSDKMVEAELKDLLNCQEKVTDDVIKLVAFNFDEDWQSFALDLGFNQDSLIDVMERFEHKTFIVYNILEKFMALHPHTTLGVLASLLKDHKQSCALERLMKYKNSM